MPSKEDGISCRPEWNSPAPGFITGRFDDRAAADLIICGVMANIKIKEDNLENAGAVQ